MCIVDAVFASTFRSCGCACIATALAIQLWYQEHEEQTRPDSCPRHLRLWCFIVTWRVAQPAHPRSRSWWSEVRCFVHFKLLSHLCKHTLWLYEISTSKELYISSLAFCICILWYALGVIFGLALYLYTSSNSYSGNNSSSNTFTRTKGVDGEADSWLT